MERKEDIVVLRRVIHHQSQAPEAEGRRGTRSDSRKDRR